MGIFSKMFARTAPVEKSAPGFPSTGGIIPPLGSSPTASGLLVSQATAMTNSVVWRCVTLRAQDIARCRPRLMTRDKAGNAVEVTEHPIAALLRRPNRVQTWFEFMEQLTAFRLLRGNAYAVIIRDGRGTPKELIAVNPDAVMMLEATDGSLFYNVNRLGLFQIAMLQNLPQSIPAEDMLHFRGVTFNMLVGVSPISQARDEIALGMSQTQQASRWLGNGARPSGLLKTKGKLTQDAAARLKASWTAFISGTQNVGTTAVLEDGMDWQQVQFNSVDMEFTRSRDQQMHEIARFFGVPAWKLGGPDAVRSLDIPRAQQEYVNEVVAPDLDRMEQRLNETFDLTRDGLYVDFDEASLLRADTATQVSALRLAVLTSLMTPNEARKEMGLPSLPEGDKLLAPNNAAALGSDVSGTAPDGAGRPAGGNAPAPSAGSGSSEAG